MNNKAKYRGIYINQKYNMDTTPQVESQQTVLPISENDNLQRVKAVLKEVASIELLPILLDLVEKLKLGEISPKDFENATGRIRMRLTRERNLLQEIPDLDLVSEDRIKEIEEQNVHLIGLKKTKLLEFREKVAKRLPLPPLQVESIVPEVEAESKEEIGDQLQDLTSADVEMTT